jgi:hypothetical protein
LKNRHFSQSIVPRVRQQPAERNAKMTCPTRGKSVDFVRGVFAVNHTRASQAPEERSAARRASGINAS